jgi:hypothetical protein
LFRFGKPALLDKEHSEPVGSHEQTPVKLQAAAQTRFDFALRRETPVITQCPRQKEPEIGAIGENANTFSRGLNGSIIVSALRQKRDGSLSPIDIHAELSQPGGDRFASFAVAARSNQSADLSVTNCRILRVARCRGCKNLQGLVDATAALVDAGQLELRRRIVGMSPNNLMQDLFAILTFAELLECIGEREAQTEVVWKALDGGLKHFEGTLRIGSPLSVL